MNDRLLAVALLLVLLAVSYYVWPPKLSKPAEICTGFTCMCSCDNDTAVLEIIKSGEE